MFIPAIINWTVWEALLFAGAVMALGGVANSVGGLLDDIAVQGWRWARDFFKGKDDGT